MGIRIPQSLRRTFSAVEKSYLIPAMAGILIGGESRRFGSPKWKAEIDSVPVLERLWKTCDGFESRIVIGKNKPVELDKPFLSDESNLQAPIIGLQTLLKNSEHNWNLLLSCDLPLLLGKPIKLLWESRDDRFDMIIPEAAGRLQVTCALCHRRLEKTVSEAIYGGLLSLKDLADKSAALTIDMESSKGAFHNMNTRADWEKINLQPNKSTRLK